MAALRLAIVLSVLCSSTTFASDASPQAYVAEIKPLLRARCYACHGGLKQEANLRLDTARSILTGGDSGPAINTTTPLESLLLERVMATDPDERMPPEHEGEALSTEEIQLLRDWIVSGAPGPADEVAESNPAEHWAFQPIVRPSLKQEPTVASPGNTIDLLLARGHRRHHLTPQQEADRLTLIRRLYLDLVGVPPEPAELDRWRRETSVDWLEQLADALLQDPRHGERWGRHWMDVWRYSDWWGLGQQLRNSQKHIWHWRDWIVESLNADLGYQEMVQLMLAGDELHPNDLDRLRATGFLARNYFLFNRPQWMAETVEHVSKGFLGLTMNCAQCHDHKFDPIRQVDYYRMRAFFEPYHVRMDMLPGEPNLGQDGIPRVFDGHLSAPTYRYIRGDEKQPDKSRKITPGVPDILSFAPLEITPVDLPDAAWQPQRRPWVIHNLRQQARQKVARAEESLAQAKTRLAATQQNLAQVRMRGKLVDGGPAPAPVRSDFRQPGSERWKRYGGEWKQEPDGISQRKDGAQQAALQLQGEAPRDFEAIFRFSIAGGSRWRSVGLQFDATPSDPTATPSSTDTTQNVYVSAYSGGPKVQASYRQGAPWQYPPEGSQSRDVPLNEPLTLRVRVRGTLINAALNGEPAIAWETPLARRKGNINLTTFDVLATLHSFEIKPLPEELELRPPVNAGSTTSSSSVAGARAAVEAAELGLQLARAARELAEEEQKSIGARAAAMQAEWSQAPKDERGDSRKRAILSERAVKLAQAKHSVAISRQNLRKAPANQRAEAEKKLQADLEVARKAEETIAKPVPDSETFPDFEGARWTPTRFFSSSKDDPEVTFPSQSTGRRTALANWIVDKRNPLTARVAANHIWMRHMGAPLVPTVFDFGRKGPTPVQLELLNWLAAELQDHNWSLKHLHRTIVTSAAYRRSSSVAGCETQLAQDADNHFWWRRTPMRLESQVVRDSILELGGHLDAQLGGPPVPRAAQAQSRRRSLYFFHSNNERNLFLTTFDEALVKDCYRREQSVVPQQALALSNSQLANEGAARIAARLNRLHPEEDNFVRIAFQLILGIDPSAEELQHSIAALSAWREAGQADPQTQFVWVLLNHNDFVTVR